MKSLLERLDFLNDNMGSAIYEDADTCGEAAAELRRLHALNAGLLEALAWIANRCPVHLMDHPLHNIHKEMAHDAGARARYAIAKAESKKKNPGVL